MKFENKCQKLGISEEVESIIENCECGEIHGARIVELSKMRKWEIQEEIGNYLDAHLYGSEFCLEGKKMKTFCEAFGIEESEVASYYAEAICEWGYEIAYMLESNKDVVLILN